jgi:hypothetical protein
VPFRTQLEHNVATDVGGPEVALCIDSQTMWHGKETIPKTAKKLAACIVFHQHRLHALEEEDVAAFVDSYGGGFSEIDAVRQLEEAGLKAIRQLGDSLKRGCGRFCAINAPLAVSETTNSDANQFFTFFNSSIH